jgi:hypothetical protein
VGRCGDDFRRTLAAAKEDKADRLFHEDANPVKRTSLKYGFCSRWKIRNGHGETQTRGERREVAAGRRADGCKGVRSWSNASTDD